MNSLYPLKFKPLFKEKIWGGKKINSILKKDFSPLSNCGESWEISSVKNNISIVSDGFLAGNDLNELIEVYMGDLVGDKVYEKFGNEFPLLIKFIDANDFLSLQVHPDDTLALKKHNSFGKTEMWYIIQADENAKLISGFNKEVNQNIYQENLKNNTLKEILNYETVKAGDVYFIPAGRVHAIGPGILLAEIQQTSDITYRIYDWERIDDKGNSRELHTKQALNAIDYKYLNEYKTFYEEKINQTNEIINCPYFKTNNLIINKAIQKDYYRIDSFVIYICIEGELNISYQEGTVSLIKGETILIPAETKSLSLQPNKETKLLEVYLP